MHQCASVRPIPNGVTAKRTELCNAPHMTTQRRSSGGDGHAFKNGAVGHEGFLEELPTGAFDLLAAQIEKLRQEIDYLTE